MFRTNEKLEPKAKYVVSGSRSDLPWQNTLRRSVTFERRSRR